MNDDILSAYRLDPMQDGDVVLFVREHRLATEVAGLADAWDAELCRNLARVLREIDAHEVSVGISRPGALLRPRDHALVGDLREELAGSGVTVHEPIPLPSAAAA